MKSGIPWCIERLPDDMLRYKAEMAWLASRDLVDALGDWLGWLERARALKRATVVDAQALQGRIGTALNTLHGLEVTRRDIVPSTVIEFVFGTQEISCALDVAAAFSRRDGITDLLRQSQQLQAALEAAPLGSLREEAGTGLTKSEYGNPRVTINDRLMALLAQRPESHGWSKRQFAEALQCGPTAVVNTVSWQNLMKMREATKAERIEAAENLRQGHRKGRA